MTPASAPPATAAAPARRTLFGRSAEWLGAAPVLPQHGLLLFSACDPRYLDFAVPLVRSLEVFAPGHVLVLHLINPGNAEITRVQALAAQLEHTQLVVSVERIDLSSLKPSQQRAYHASARFLRLAELLEPLALPVLSLDADSLVVAPIDGNFSAKPAAELCLVRREPPTPDALHLAVANGSIWLRPTERVNAWLQQVADDLVAAFENGTADWYVDQLVVARQIAAHQHRLGVFSINGRYADWEFKRSGIVWSGKGQRKSADMRFALLRGMLLDAPHKQVQALRAAREAFADESESSADMRRKIDMASTAVPPRVVLFMPRLDQPWGSALRGTQVPPLLADDTLALRLHWTAFGARLANAIERKGVQVDLLEVPAWQIDTDSVDHCGADLAIIPHRCRLDFTAGRTPLRYYMQEFFRWVFVLDAQGWGAAAGNYPVRLADLGPAPGGAFDAYRQRLQANTLDSKFGQPQRQPRQALVRAGQIPDRPYLFFPLQIPHDQSIRYFSDHSERSVVEALLAWCRQRGLALVLKPHPVNAKAMAEFESLARAGGAVWSSAHVHDLIAHAQAVYTINSGVGFEALFHLKPVVSFGRVEYDCVSIRATPDSLDAAWSQVLACDSAVLEARYRQFVDWFLGQYAVDLSRPESAQPRLEQIASDIATDARRLHASKTASRTTTPP